MANVEKMRAFIIRVLYIALWAGIVYAALKYAMPLFMPFLIAFVISFLLRPLIDKITRRLPLSRRVVAVLVLVLVYAVLGTLVVFAGSRLVIQISRWFAELPRYYSSYIEPAADNVVGWLNDFSLKLSPALTEFFDAASDSISSAVSNVISALSSGAINFLSSMATSVPWVLVGFGLAIIASFFFVMDYHKITGFLMAQFSDSARRRFVIIRDYAVNVLWRFLRAYLILMSVTFVEVSVGLLILRVENPFLIAFFTALVDILPIFGTGTVMIPWILYTFFVGNYGLAIGLTVLYVIITVVRQFLEPKVVGKQIGLYPLLTLISMFIGVQVFGFWGLFALPIALTVLVHLNRSGEISLFKEPAYQTVTVHPDQTETIVIDDPDEKEFRDKEE